MLDDDEDDDGAMAALDFLSSIAKAKGIKDPEPAPRPIKKPDHKADGAGAEADAATEPTKPEGLLAAMGPPPPHPLKPRPVAQPVEPTAAAAAPPPPLQPPALPPAAPPPAAAPPPPAASAVTQPPVMLAYAPAPAPAPAPADEPGLPRPPTSRPPKSMMATIAAATPAAAGLPAAAVGLPVLPPPPPDSAAEARSSRVKALLERTARLGERRGSSGGAAAAGIDDPLSAMSSRVSSPTLSDGPPPSLPWLPSLPRLPPGVSPSRASSSSRADEHMLRIVQARLASLSATRARVDRLLAAEQAELEAALQHLLAHARCRSSEHAAAAQMAAAMHRLAGDAAEGDKARGVTELYGALQSYCEATESRMRLEQQSQRLLDADTDADSYADSDGVWGDLSALVSNGPPAALLHAAEATATARAAAAREAAAARAAEATALVAAETAATVAWPVSGEQHAVGLAGGAELHWAARGERMKALWGDVTALQHSIDAEAAELHASPFNGGGLGRGNVNGGGGGSCAGGGGFGGGVGGDVGERAADAGPAVVAAPACSLRTPATSAQEPARASPPSGEEQLQSTVSGLQAQLRTEQRARLQAEEQSAAMMVQQELRNEVLEARLRELEGRLQGSRSEHGSPPAA